MAATVIKGVEVISSANCDVAWLTVGRKADTVLLFIRVVPHQFTLTAGMAVDTAPMPMPMPVAGLAVVVLAGMAGIFVGFPPSIAPMTTASCTLPLVTHTGVVLAGGSVMVLATPKAESMTLRFCSVAVVDDPDAKLSTTV